MNLIIKYSIWIALFIATIQLHAQQNVDSIFNKAILFSRNNEYNKAISEANKALQADSQRADIYVFKANVYSWKNNNDSALLVLNNARNLNYLNDEFYDAALNILLRANKNDSLLKVCDEAEKQGYKDSRNLIFKRLIAYENKEDYDKITTMLGKEENKKYLEDKAIADLLNRVKGKDLNHIIAVDYTLDMFQKIPAHHYVSLAYTTKVKSLSTTVGLNYATRFGKNDLQIEYTGYKTLASENYWYLNYGYAFGNLLFPKHRAGLEYNFKLSSHWDASLGGRYLLYPLATDKNIWILTGNIGAYVKNSWFTIRPFYVIHKSAKSLSFSTKYRLYDENPANFFGVEFGFGNSPDDSYTVSQGSFNQLMSYRIKMEKNILLSDKSQLFLAAGLVFEEFYVSNSIDKRNRFIIDLGYRFKF